MTTAVQQTLTTPFPHGLEISCVVALLDDDLSEVSNTVSELIADLEDLHSGFLAQMAVHDLEERITRLNSEKEKLKKALDEKVTGLLSSGDVRSGPFEIVVDREGRRTINADRCRQVFPAAFDKAKEIKETVTIARLRKVLSDEEIDFISDKGASTYRIDYDPRFGVEP